MSERRPYVDPLLGVGGLRAGDARRRMYGSPVVARSTQAGPVAPPSVGSPAADLELRKLLAQKGVKGRAKWLDEPGLQATGHEAIFFPPLWAGGMFGAARNLLPLEADLALSAPAIAKNLPAIVKKGTGVLQRLGRVGEEAASREVYIPIPLNAENSVRRSRFAKHLERFGEKPTYTTLPRGEQLGLLEQQTIIRKMAAQKAERMLARLEDVQMPSEAFDPLPSYIYEVQPERVARKSERVVSRLRSKLNSVVAGNEIDALSTTSEAAQGFGSRGSHFLGANIKDARGMFNVMNRHHLYDPYYQAQFRERLKNPISVPFNPEDGHSFQFPMDKPNPTSPAGGLLAQTKENTMMGLLRGTTARHEVDHFIQPGKAERDLLKKIVMKDGETSFQFGERSSGDPHKMRTRSDGNLPYMKSWDFSETRAWLGELYDHISIKKGIPLNKPFAVTEQDVIDGLETIVKDPLYGSFKNQSEFVLNVRHNPRLIAEYLSKAVIGTAALSTLPKRDKR